MVELAKTMNFDNLGLLFVGEAGSYPEKDLFPHLLHLFAVVFMHEFELTIEFNSKELELLDKLNPGGISELKDSGVVNSAKCTDLCLGPVDCEARDATEVLEDVEDLIQLLEVFLEAKRLEEQGQVIGIPFSQGLEVSLGCPRSDLLGGEELEEEDLDCHDEEVSSEGSH